MAQLDRGFVLREHSANVAGVETTGRNDGTIAVSVAIPFLNAMKYLPRTAPSVIAAARRSGNVEIIFVDNGSTDGSAEYVQSLATNGIRLFQRPGSTIGAMRNWGARQGTGQYISFLDVDCLIAENYFERAVAELVATGAAATGCEVHVPDHPHWLERTLHDLHYIGRDRDVTYINSANFFVTREAFERIEGFRQDLVTGEDADFGHRLIVAGFRIRECTEVKAVHYGNPASIGEYYRRVVWHGVGMWATVTRHRLDKPTTMLAVHVLATIAGIALLLAPFSLAVRVMAVVVLQALAPAATVAYRIRQTRRFPSLGAALVLYWLYYWARMHALGLLIFRRAATYRK